MVLVLAADPALLAGRHHRVMIADKNYYGREFEAAMGAAGIELLRPARKGEPPRAGARFFRPLRQTIESIFDIVKGQLDLERHGGHTITGVAVRVYIWHNDRTGQPVKRSLLAYDHWPSTLESVIQ